MLSVSSLPSRLPYYDRAISAHVIEIAYQYTTSYNLCICSHLCNPVSFSNCSSGQIAMYDLKIIIRIATYAL